VDETGVDRKLPAEQSKQPACSGYQGGRKSARSGRVTVGVAQLALLDGFDYRGSPQVKKTRVLKERLSSHCIETL
jgi:hypothetical protein